MNFNDMSSSEGSQTNLDNVDSGQNLNFYFFQKYTNLVTDAQNQAQISDEVIQSLLPKRENDTQDSSLDQDIAKNVNQNTSTSSNQQTTNPPDQKYEQEIPNDANSQLCNSFTSSSRQQMANPDEQNQEQQLQITVRSSQKEEQQMEKLNQIQQFRYNEMFFIELQIETESVISEIVQKYDQFLKFQNGLNQILKYSPKPKDNSNDESQQEYVENIKKLKNIIYILIDFPQKYNKLQNQVQNALKDLTQTHMLLCTHIKNLLKVTYIINKDNLGSNYDQLQEIKKSLDSCKTESEGLCNYLYEIQSVNHLITEHYSIFFAKENKDYASELQNLNEEYQKVLNEVDIQQNKVLHAYQQTNLAISQKNANIETHNTSVKLLQQDIKDLKSKLELFQKNMEKIINQDENTKQSYLKKLTEDRDKIIRDKQAFIDKKNSDQEIKLNQYQQQVNDLNKKYPLSKMCSLVEKKCFHYIFIQDESSSFASDHQYAVDGVTKLFDKINPDDYITYIKFDSSAQIKIGKTIKRNLTSSQFRSNIQNCRGGGTSFLAAFQALQQQIQNYYDEKEYPVVIFITCGQESSNIDSISNSILSICLDIVFYTIGYGSVNEQYLKNITNKFNNTVGEKKEINGKNVNLFYVKHTPDELVQSLSLISQQQSRITIEDIKKAQEFLKESFNSMSKTKEEHYSKLKDSYDKRLSLINNQIKELSSQNINSTNEMTKFMFNEIQKQQEYIIKLEQDETKEKSSINSLIYDIKQLKLEFLQSVYYDKQDEIDKLNLEQVLEKQLKSIKDQSKSEIDECKQKIIQFKQKIDQLQVEKENDLVQLGFQNFQHFSKFNELFGQSEESQKFYINLIQNLNMFITQLSYQNQAFDQSIENSKTYLEESSKLDNWYHVFTQFKQIDESIDPENRNQSIRKILFIINSSIEEKCKDDPIMQKFYDQVISAIDFNEIIQTVVNKKREEQVQYIKNKVIPEILKNKPKELTKLEKYEERILLKIRKLKRAVKNLREELKEELDQNKKAELEDEIEQYDQELKELNKDLEESKKQSDEILFEFETENSDKINIINQVVMSLIQATMFAFFKKKSQMASNPFYYLLNSSNSFLKILRGYKTCAIENGSKK
ncbi:hypothetical protein ABPG74_010425 [Tetrahymena malaccensis]